MLNLYYLREKWAVVYRDSFIADMTTTQRSEGMNNIFKKRFHRKLGLSELEMATGTRPLGIACPYPYPSG
jgi:hypothetical protein